MKRNRFTENQIVSILKEAESGISVPELCRKYGVGQSTLPNAQSVDEIEKLLP